MPENVENLILTQLRDIRARLDAVDARLGTIEGEVGEGRLRRIEDKMDELAGKVLANTTVVLGLAQYLGTLNERVEHIENHLGVAT